MCALAAKSVGLLGTSGYDLVDQLAMHVFAFDLLLLLVGTSISGHKLILDTKPARSTALTSNASCVAPTRWLLDKL